MSSLILLALIKQTLMSNVEFRLPERLKTPAVLLLCRSPGCHYQASYDILLLLWNTVKRLTPAYAF